MTWITPMTQEEKRAYQRGYARRNQWPEHKPPLPPDPILKELVTAARELRDCVDSQCAMMDPEDEMMRAIGPGIDKLDAALTLVGKWLKSSD